MVHVLLPIACYPKQALSVSVGQELRTAGRFLDDLKAESWSHLKGVQVGIGHQLRLLQ